MLEVLLELCQTIVETILVKQKAYSRFTSPYRFQPYDHKLWVVIKRAELQIQACKMSFLRRAAVLSLSNRVKSSVILGELGVEPLLIYPIYTVNVKILG